MWFDHANESWFTRIVARRRKASLTDEEKARTREAIVAAGHEQVAEGGWAAASVVDVARRAGVSTGALYRHFSGKGELCAEIFRAAADARGVADARDRRPRR